MKSKLTHYLRTALSQLFISFVFIFLAATIYNLYYSPPWKTIDPKSSDFKAENFQFHDYETPESLDEALRTMFPVGTPKGYVDNILYSKHIVKAGHLDNNGESAGITSRNPTGVWKSRNYAQIIKDRDLNGWVYLYRNPFTLQNTPPVSIYVYFDKNDKVVEIIHNSNHLLSPRNLSNE